MTLGAGIVLGADVNVRWTLYLLISPFAFFFLFQIRDTFLLFLALLGPLILLEDSLISMRPAGPIYIGIFLPVALATLLSVKRNMKNVGQIRGFVFAWIVFIAFAATGMLREPDNLQSAGREFQIIYLQSGLLIYLGRVLIQKEVDLENLAKAVIAISLVCSLLQLFFFRTGIPLLQPTYDELLLGKAAWRYGGPLANPNTLANLFAISSSCLLLLFLNEGKKANRVLFGCLGAILLASTIVSGSRGGTLALIIGILFSLLFAQGRGRAGLTLVPILGFLAMGASPMLFPETINVGYQRLIGESDAVRFDIWLATLDLLETYPMGLGLTPQIFAQELNRIHPGMHYANPHSIYLGLLIHTGVFGFLAFAAMVFIALRKGLGPLLGTVGKTPSPILLIPAACILIFLFGGVTEPIYSNGHKLNHLFWLFIGAATRIPSIFESHHPAAEASAPTPKAEHLAIQEMP